MFGLNALSALYELGLNWDDYPEEPIIYDGTVLHSIERLLPIICNYSGYEYRASYSRYSKAVI